jgi:hypothetical protein
MAADGLYNPRFVPSPHRYRARKGPAIKEAVLPAGSSPLGSTQHGFAFLRGSTVKAVAAEFVGRKEEGQAEQAVPTQGNILGGFHQACRGPSQRRVPCGLLEGKSQQERL